MIDPQKDSVTYHETTPIPGSGQPVLNEIQNIPKQEKLLKSFWGGLKDFTNGESYANIFGYFWPELISAMMFTAFLPMIDSLFVAGLKSTTAYATLSVVSNFVHFMKKLAEGLTIGAIVLCGQYNGIGRYAVAGQTLRDIFWITVAVGGTFSALFVAGAPYICAWYGMPDSMLALGVPLLRLKAIGAFFMFISVALSSFLRGIKNPRPLMMIFMVSGSCFVFFDYVLLYGKWGFPCLGVYASAAGDAIQYGIMSCITMCYILFHRDNEKFHISLKPQLPDWHTIKLVFKLSWPPILDKASFAASYIWLGSMVTSMGENVIASFGVIKDLERFAFLPAIAFASVITFLVSNSYSRRDWQGIKSNIKKILFLAIIVVMGILMSCCLFSQQILPWFDHNHEFTAFAARALPYVSVLAFFDVGQIILSGALRGSTNVRTVMITRISVFFGFVFPVTYFISTSSAVQGMMKFFLIYSTFYFGHLIMIGVYIWRFRGEAWKGAILETSSSEQLARKTTMPTEKQPQI